MSKFKKLVAGALATVICSMSIVPNAEAHAACNHTIYYKGVTLVSSAPQYHAHTENNKEYMVVNVKGIPQTIEVEKWTTIGCHYTLDTYEHVYACTKCSYSYTSGGYTVGAGHDH